MWRKKLNPEYVSIRLFYEFAKTMIQDIESLEVEIERLKKHLAVKR